MNIATNPLPYADKLESRDLSAVHLIVIHCTELPNLSSARVEGEIPRYPSGTGNSGHYYVDRNGRVEEYVPVEFIAHHTRGYNPQSIGIELVNQGRYPDWLHSKHQDMLEAYAGEQITALLALIQHLKVTCQNVSLIAGHEDLDRTEVPATDDHEILVRRKRDPGPRFPWQQILAASGLTRHLPT